MDSGKWAERYSVDCDLFTHLSDVGGPMALNNLQVLEMLNKHVELIKKDQGGHSSHTSQNN